MYSLSFLDSNINSALAKLSYSPSYDAYKSLADAYYLLLEFNVDNFDPVVCGSCIDCLSFLRFNDPAFQIRVAQLISKILHRNRENMPNFIVDKFFDYILDVDFSRRRGVYNSLMHAFFLHSRQWWNFADFCDWWDFSNFNPSDFEPHSVGIPMLGINVYLAYARTVLKWSLGPSLFGFFSDFALQASRGGFNEYANYYIAQFLNRAGCDRDVVLRFFRPFVVLKFRKPWTWLAVSSVFPVSDIRRKACLYFALHNVLGNADSRDSAVYFYLARYYRDIHEMDYCAYFVRLLREMGGSWLQAADDEFPNALEHASKVTAPEVFDFRSICHDIFANVADADSCLWKFASLWINDLSSVWFSIVSGSAT